MFGGGIMETNIKRTLVTEELPVLSDFIETIAEQRVGPGIILLSSSLHLMHMNRRAWGLSRKITQAHNGKTATGVLPTAVTQHCAEAVTAFPVRTNAKDWDQAQTRRLGGTTNPPAPPRAFAF